MRRVRAYILVLTVLLAACSAAPEPGEDSNSGLTDCSCSADEACVHGECVALSDATGAPYGIEIYDLRPSSPTRGEVIYELGPDEISIDHGIVDVVLPEPFYIRGTVSSPGDRIATTISISRPSVIPGRGNVTKSQPLGLVGSDELAVHYEFEFRRPAQYTVQVIPQKIEIAAPVTLVRDVSDSTSINIPVGVPVLTVEGTVVDGDGEPVANAMVWAMDVKNNVVSTTAVTDEDGAFSVWFAQQPQDLNLVVGPSEYKVTVPAVAFRYGPTFYEMGRFDANMKKLDLGNIEIPSLPAPVVYSTTVVGQSSSGVSEPVSGARVIFYARVGGGTLDDGVYLAEGTTDASGEISLQLIPGEHGLNRTYTVLVVPPLDSPYAFCTMETEVGPVSGVGPEIQLAERPVLVGRVTGTGGIPLEDVLVSAVPMDVTGLQAYLLSDYQPSVRTSEDGRFALPLNPGEYDVTFRHPSYPALRLEDVEVPAATEMTVMMPDRRAVVVRVADEEGAPLEGVEVRLYRAEQGCTAGQQCQRSALMVSSGTTGADGSVPLLVSPP